MRNNPISIYNQSPEFNSGLFFVIFLNKLKKSLEQTGYVELVAIDIDNTIIAGHMRITALISMGLQEKEIEVRVPERKLTQEEFNRYLIASNKTTGEWDINLLANFDDQLLLDVGFGKNEINDIFDLSPFSKNDIGCQRCEDLKKSISGHHKKSGHEIEKILTKEIE